MKKERRQPRHFDDQFRLSVLKDESTLKSQQSRPN